ncbi:hypothetical protein BDN71DRAFT_1453109 [Pleurotus eryngii]|uniref:Uncharacterized protein n=1 Tax=Pleurotus eryngii TaxID=5323 RepID=A0A9P6DBZ4_PLEER|nr:hypothetical protein BDN71DRAFT_1453109 [Pleurotus eryngii]
MVLEHYDEETGIFTIYNLSIEGARIDFNDSWCPGATISLYEQAWWPSAGRKLLYTMIDCPKELLWTLPKPEYLMSDSGIQIEYLEDGYMRQEVLATEEEAVDIARRAVYDECGQAHIAVSRTLSVGISTVWLEGSRDRWYHEPVIYNVPENNAAARCLPYSQFIDDLPQPETQLIRHRGSNRGDDRPCYLTLHISLGDFFQILCVDWSYINNSPAFPLRSDAFRSLNSLHLKFPSPASQDCNPNSSSQFHQDDLTITISPREISFSTGTNTVPLGNRFTLSSEHRTVTVNYINAIMGDAFLGTINGGNNGGRNNVNTSTHLSLIITLCEWLISFDIQFAYRVLLVLVRLV